MIAPLDRDVSEIVERLGETIEAFAGKTVLITGGHGFLGRYLSKVLEYANNHSLSQRCRLVLVDNHITSGADAGAPASGVFIPHDIIQTFHLDEPVDFVIHAAGIASPFYYRKFPLETLEVATLGTKNMLEFARDKRAVLLFFSSSEIYGDPDPAYVPTPESYRGNVSCLGPRACYDESKRLGETLTRIYHDYFGVDAKIVRPFNVYGPGMSEADYRVLPNFGNRIVGGRPLRVYGSGRQTRTFCYVADAITGFLQVLVHGVPGEAYNVGSSSPEVSMLELTERVRTVLARELKVERVDYPDSYPADEPSRRCPDLQKAHIHVGYAPTTDLNDGLGRFFDWALATYTGEILVQ